MKKPAKILICIALLSISIIVPSVFAQGDNLKGVWKIIEIKRLGENPQIIKFHRPSSVIFTKKYFSLVNVHGEIVPDLPENPTDSQLAAAYKQLTVVTGSYEVKNSTINYKVEVSQVPNRTGNTGQWDFRFEGDILILHTEKAPIEFRLTRLE